MIIGGSYPGRGCDTDRPTTRNWGCPQPFGGAKTNARPHNTAPRTAPFLFNKKDHTLKRCAQFAWFVFAHSKGWGHPVRLSELASRASDAKEEGVGYNVPVSSPVRQHAMVQKLPLKDGQVYGLAGGHGCRAAITKAAVQSSG